MKKLIASFAVVLIGILLFGSVYMFCKTEGSTKHADAGKSSVTNFKPVSGRQVHETHAAAQNEKVKQLIEASNISPQLRSSITKVIVEQTIGDAAPEVAKLLISNDYKELGTELLEEALIQNPLDADTLLELGSVYQASGKLEDFKRTWESILTTYPASLDLYVALAQFYAEALDVEQGLSILESGVNMNPMDNQFRYAVGDWLEIQGMNVEAEQQYAYALQVDPDDAIANMRLGELYLKRGENAIAEWYFTKAIQIEPEYADVIQELKEEVTYAL